MMGDNSERTIKIKLSTETAHSSGQNTLTNSAEVEGKIKRG